MSSAATMAPPPQQQPWRVDVGRLCRDASEASELARVLQEVAPGCVVGGGGGDAAAALAPPRARASTSSGGGGRSSGSGGGGVGSLRERVRVARALDVAAPGSVPWADLVAALPADAIAGLDLAAAASPTAAPPLQQQQQQSSGGDGCAPPSPLHSTGRASPLPGGVVQVSSGGAVFFLLFRGQQQQDGDSGGETPVPQTKRRGRRESVAVLKVAGSRLSAQAELFASELARHVGVATPAARLVRQAQRGPHASSPSKQAPVLDGNDDGPESSVSSGSTNSDDEWAAAHAAAVALGPDGEDLARELGRLPVFLLLEYVAGRPLLPALKAPGGLLVSSHPGTGCDGAAGGDNHYDGDAAALAMMADIGRLLALDALLGNADRLPVADLGWRGNAGNALLGDAGSRYAGRAVAIDATVARRPPLFRAGAEDAAVERLAQLIVAGPNDGAHAAAVLAQIFASGSGGDAGDAGGAALPAGAVVSAVLQPSRVAAFRKGFIEAVAAATSIKGLLEMAHGRTTEWTAEFFDDAATVAPALRLRPAAGGGGGSYGGAGAGAAAPLPPLTELAAGMRTPPHLVSPRLDMGGGGSSAGRGSSASSPTPPQPLFAGALQQRHMPRGSRSFVLRTHRAGSALPATDGGIAEAAPTSPRDGPGATAMSRDLAALALAAPASVQQKAAAARSAVRSLFSQLPLSAEAAGAGGNTNSNSSSSDRATASGRDNQAVAATAAPPAAAPAVSPRPIAGLSPRGSASFDAAGRRASSHATAAAAAAAAAGSLDRAVTGALASIASEARHGGALAERVAEWKDRLRARGLELAGTIAEWQLKRLQQLQPPTAVSTTAAAASAAMTTGFLSGASPLVDAYELSVRLEHLLRRLATLQRAAAAEAPAEVAPRLYVGGAVAADSHYVLQALGITHVLNATEELLPPPEAFGFNCLRVALRDDEAEDIAFHFARVRGWVDAALDAGGAVLVHCQEGRSRSVTLLASYLIGLGGMSASAALAAVQRARPCAAPNPAFIAALHHYEGTLRGGGGDGGGLGSSGGDGSSSGATALQQQRRGKPVARVCPICKTAVGVSMSSLAVHMRAHHHS